MYALTSIRIKQQTNYMSIKFEFIYLNVLLLSDELQTLTNSFIIINTDYIYYILINY